MRTIYTTICGLHVVNTMSVFEDFVKSFLPEDVDEHSAEAVPFFKEFCRMNDLYYYAAPRDQFNQNKAYANAHKEGRKFVILEDLS